MTITANGYALEKRESKDRFILCLVAPNGRIRYWNMKYMTTGQVRDCHRLYRKCFKLIMAQPEMKTSSLTGSIASVLSDRPVLAEKMVKQIYIQI